MSRPARLQPSSNPNDTGALAMNLARKPHFRITVAAALMAASAAASAWTTEWKDARIALDNAVTIGAVMRVQDPKKNLIGIANGGTAYSVNEDDGNLNFEAGKLSATIFQLKTDFSIKYDNYGLFVRSLAYVNPTVLEKGLFDEADYGPGKEAGYEELRSKRKAVRDRNGARATLLDAFAYGDFDVLDQSVTVKVGQQVLNWGESTFIQNGLNSLVSFDANRLITPGFELNEITVPVPMLLVSTTLIPNVSIDGFYQLGWKRTVIHASGSYFGSNDFAGIAGTRAYIDFGRAGENAPAGSSCQGLPPGAPTCVPFGNSVVRADDRTPGSSGQYGGSLHIFLPDLNSTDLTLYAARYHSRLPLFSGTSRASPSAPATDANYFSEYPKGIEMLGLSFNTAMPFGYALQAEYSFKHGQPLQLQAVELLLTGLGQPSQIDPIPGDSLGNKYIRGYRRHNVSQVDVSITQLFAPNRFLGYDDLLFLAEAGYTYVHDLPSQSPGGMFYEGQATYLPGEPGTAAALGLPTQDQAGFPTKGSWGYRVLLRPTYNNLFVGGLIVQPTLIWQHDVAGLTPVPLINFVRDRRTLTPLLTTRIGQSLQVEVGYTLFMGGGQQNLIGDRDFVQANLKYSF